MNEAGACGHKRLLLDAAPFMTAAHRVYEAAGFKEPGPSPGVEVPEQAPGEGRFMELEF